MGLYMYLCMERVPKRVRVGVLSKKETRRKWKGHGAQYSLFKKGSPKPNMLVLDIYKLNKAPQQFQRQYINFTNCPGNFPEFP